MTEIDYALPKNGISEDEKETDPITSEKPLEWPNTAAEPPENTAPLSHWTKPSDRAPQRTAMLSIDWLELEGALENNSPELHSFLNLTSGEVIRVFRGSENAVETLSEMDNSPDYLYIEPISSREQYRWMEEFIENTPESALKDKLNVAVDGKGAFRRFKDVLVGYPEDRERWFSQRSGKLRAHITDWLNAKDIQPLNLDDWPEPNADNIRETYRRMSREGEENASPTVDLRQSAHELIDLLPSRELPTAVAFLDFLRSRRAHRRTRFGG